MEKEKRNIDVNEQLEIVEYTNENIKKLIQNIRGKQVLLDSDVAMLYHYETKNINKAMKRNIERFPEDFCFQLTKEELNSMWFQNGTTYENIKYRSEKYLPYAYTEQGISMLAGVLKNDIAIHVSISIIRAFIEMRKFISANGQVFQEINKINRKLLEHDKQFDKVFDELQNKKGDEFKEKIFFNGQIWDSYNLIIDIIKSAQNKILIIDNYIDDSILKMLTKKNKNVEVVILTSTKCDVNKLDINKFNKQYPILKVAKSNKFHDRFIVIDDKKLYHCGASLKDLGKKCFAISIIEDKEYLEKLMLNI